MTAGSLAGDGLVRPPAAVAGRYRAEGLWRDDLLHEYVLRHAGRAPEAVALVRRDTQLTYRELAAAVETVAGRLGAAGLGHGDRVLLQLPNEIEAVTTMLALMRLGARPVLTLPSLREREVRHVAALAAPRAFVVAAASPAAYALQVARRLRGEYPQLDRLIVLGHAALHGDELDLAAAHRADAGTGPVSQRPGRSAAGPGDVAMYLLSAGTTGLPKPIPRTHQDYVYNVRVSAGVCSVTAETVYLAALPVLHNFALGCPGVLGTLSAGGRVVLSPPDPETVLRLIERERVTLTALVPGLAMLVAEAARDHGGDTSSLRGVQVGGARLPAGHADEIRAALGCAVQQVYGMAEGLLNFTRWDDPWEVVRQTQGRPASPADEWRIVDSSGTEVGAGGSGELLVRGPYTIRGYLAPAAANAAASAGACP